MTRTTKGSAALLLATALSLLCGCATTTTPLQLSADTYLISKTSSAGAFASRAGMQAKVIKEANEFAASRGKVAVCRAANWERPARGFPTFEYQFILVDASDPRANDVTLQPKNSD